MKVFISLLVLSFAVASHAAEETITNIQSGNLSAGGSFRLDQYSGNRFSTFDVNTSLGYFPWDRISLGISASIYNDDQDDTVAIFGPFAQYFFWQDGRTAASVLLGYGHGLTDATVSGRLQTRGTLHYFFSESVALGPFIDFTRVFSRYYNSFNRVGIGASFGIYL